MAVRASWQLPDLSPDEDDDPLAAPIEEVGVPIRLTGDTAELAGELVELVHDARRLKDRGLVCPIRELPDTSCSACPIVGSYGDLCGNGRRQEQLMTLLAVLDHA